ncbi:MAG: glycerophosphodiester phosphodiesterase family protein [Anaeroplasmataceae bacterium]
MKKFRVLKIIGIVLGVILVFFLTINIIPPSKAMSENPFINEGDVPMLCAHRGGSISNPENTLKAYKSAVADYNAQILETDLWMTKDGYLVLNHDETINRTSDIELIKGDSSEYKISDFTLEELRNLNFGYNFLDENGNYPYRNLVDINSSNRSEIIKDNDLSILEIGDLLEYFYNEHKEMLFIVEIKNPGEKGFEAANILDDLLTNKHPLYKNRIVIGTFHNEIEKCLKNEHPTLLRGASTSVATKFIVTQLLKVNLFDNDKFACLQLPTHQSGLNLTWKTYIKRAHRRNIAVQYWTINDEETMRELIENKCDAIMTDDPALLRKILDEYKK